MSIASTAASAATNDNFYLGSTKVGTANVGALAAGATSTVSANIGARTAGTNPVRAVGRDNWIVSGLLRDDEVAEATGFRMPEGDYETLAGLVLTRLGRIPEVNDEIQVDGWRITVLRMDRHRIAELRVVHTHE